MPIHLGDKVMAKGRWHYNPQMKRWVRRKKRGRGFEIKAYHRKEK